LASEIELVREDGLAVEDEESAPGLVAIAVPVREERGRVAAAVALEAPAQAISPEELADALVRIWSRRPT
jgi:DNA-binding IclR family transcriptional regulator